MDHQHSIVHWNHSWYASTYMPHAVYSNKNSYIFHFYIAWRCKCNFFLEEKIKVILISVVTVCIWTVIEFFFRFYVAILAIYETKTFRLFSASFFCVSFNVCTQRRKNAKNTQYFWRHCYCGYFIVFVEATGWSEFEYSVHTII